jgi:hypothetical protein
VGDFSHALQPLIGENVGAVLRDGHEVILKRVDRVRPGLQMILYLALQDTRHPIPITLVPVGIQAGRPV